MATNTVEILVTSRDQAKPDLDALKAKLDELKSEVSTARASVDDTDAAAKLDALDAKLMNLDKKTANPKITMSGAISAEAQIHAVEAALKNLDDTNKAGTTSWKDRGLAFAGAAASLTGVGDALNAANPEASMFERVMGGAGLATGLFEPVVAGATVAVGGLASGLVAAGGTLGAFGLVAKSNITAAATAAKQVQQAQDTYNASIAAGIPQAKAYQAEQKAIGVAYAELTPAQITLSKQIGDLSNQWQSFTAGFAPIISGLLSKVQPILGSLFADFSKLATAGATAIQALLPSLDMALVSPGFKKFIDMLATEGPAAIVKIGMAIGNLVKGIGGILEAFMPVSQGMLSGLDKITAAFAKWGTTLSSHTGFQSLMATFKSETPIAMQILQNLLVVLKNVGSAMAGLATGSNSKTLLQVLEPLSGILAQLSKNQDLVRIALYFLAAADAGKKLKTTVDGIQTAFGVFKNVSGAVTMFAGGLRSADVAAAEGSGVWGTFGGKIASIGSGLKGAATSVGQFAVSVGSGLKNAAVSVGQFVAQYAAQMARALAAGAVWIAEHAVMAAAFIAQNIAMAATATAAFIAENAATLGIIAGIALLIAAIVYLATHWQQVWGDLKNWALDAWHFIDSNVIQPIESGINDLVNWIESHWKLLATILATVLLGPVGTLVAFLATNWKTVTNDVSTMVTDVVNFFKNLPGEIISALGDLSNLLYNAGMSIINGLLNGLKAAWNAVAGWVSSVAGMIASLKGPLPYDRELLVPHGRAIMDGLMHGMDSRMDRLRNQVRGIAGVIAGGGHIFTQNGVTEISGGNVGAPTQLQVMPGGGTAFEQFMVQALRNYVRVRGGNVQSAIGH